MIILVDHPLVIKETYRQIFSAAEKDPDRIILPHYNGRNGHPVYFGRKYFPALQSAPVDLGARYVVHHNRAEVLEVPVGDEGILIDIDDPETYRKFITGER